MQIIGINTAQHRQSSMSVIYATATCTDEDATLCARYWMGTHLRVLHVETRRKWAFAMIAECDHPGIDIIEQVQEVSSPWPVSLEAWQKSVQVVG